MEIMKIISDLFYNPSYKAKVGDICLNLGSSSTTIVDVYNVISINSDYYSKYYSKIPFSFNSNTILTDKQVAIIEEAYKNYNENSKYREEFEFIKCYKIINNRLYCFYKHIKDLEFIPKTYDHLNNLFNCIKDRSF